jgi:hypothetical protein
MDGIPANSVWVPACAGTTVMGSSAGNKKPAQATVFRYACAGVAHGARERALSLRD